MNNKDDSIGTVNDTMMKENMRIYLYLQVKIIMSICAFFSYSCELATN